jgi:hypothetical protein
MDWKQLLSTLLGGAMALLGSIITHYLTSKRDAERRADEEAGRRLRELKAAYAEWFHGVSLHVQRVLMLFAVPATKEQVVRDAIPLAVEPMGHAVRLLEPNAEARRRTADIISAHSVMMAKLSIADHSDPRLLGREAADMMRQLAEFELWLIEVRFADGKI